ncbi:MAG: hypothetical protein H6737_21165 [Alphaproteobacteria bacterium]|nr:hypothetical protein [Alphaproteobacteria bacterium]
MRGRSSPSGETRDAGGKDGVDRQYLATGIELVLRLRNDEPAPVESLEPAEPEA